MDYALIALLIGVGLLGGFIGGLVGIGGGVIFAPALLLFYQAMGIPDATITSLTLGTSSFCVLIATGSSTIAQHRKGMVKWDVSASTGIWGGIVMYVITQLVSTQPWYDKKSFQLIFSFILLWVTFRMLISAQDEHLLSADVPQSKIKMLGIGFISGATSALAGVGGGIILVPAYNRLLKLPLKMASATSNGTITYTSFIGIFGYIVGGWHHASSIPFMFGYIDLLHGLLIAIPTIFSAQWGVQVAQRLDTTWLRRIFSLIAFLLALRLLWGALM